MNQRSGCEQGGTKVAEGRALRREEIPEKYMWNAPSLFESPDKWRQALTDLMGDIDQLAGFKGRLHEGSEIIIELMNRLTELGHRLGKVNTYAGMRSAVNTMDQDAMMGQGEARALYGKFATAQAFIEPELLEIGREILEQWMADTSALAFLQHYIDDLFRQQAHIRSMEVEEILGMLSDPFANTRMTANLLTNADFRFEPAATEDGTQIEVTQGSLQKILAGSDRIARKTAWEHYHDPYLEYKNTLAANYVTSLKQNVFKMRVRQHKSTLDMALHKDNISTDVFHNLIDAFQKNLPTWHRYWALRRRMLGVEILHPFDIWAPLAEEQQPIPYETAVDWICEGLIPLGEKYVQTLKKGALEDRWVDVYPNVGKRAGAFSSGMQGTFPFIMMSYNANIFSVSTLAHELGHSMHSYLTWENQPYVYSHYSLFVAEVASNFHQAMVRAHLLKKNTTPLFQLSVIEEAMSNFHRYFFVMPTLARFELEAHQRVEQGKGLNAAGLIDLMVDLFTEAYGGEVYVDRDRVGMTWATFGHIYIDYYVYQYATGISGAHALSRKILSGSSKAVASYLDFLKAGGSMYPLDALSMAGVDLRSPEPVEVTFDILSEMVDRLESLQGILRLDC